MFVISADVLEKKGTEKIDIVAELRSHFPNFNTREPLFWHKVKFFGWLL
jgi:hypothetical protein